MIIALKFQKLLIFLIDDFFFSPKFDVDFSGFILMHLFLLTLCAPKETDVMLIVRLEWCKKVSSVLTCQLCVGLSVDAMGIVKYNTGGCPFPLSNCIYCIGGIFVMTLIETIIKVELKIKQSSFNYTTITCSCDHNCKRCLLNNTVEPYKSRNMVYGLNL